MWLYSPDWFASVVTQRRPGELELVARFRFRSHLDAFVDELLEVRKWPHVAGRPGTVTEEADYRYRVDLTGDELRAILSRVADRLTYPNFKLEASLRPSRTVEAAADRRRYVRVLSETWGAAADGQQDRAAGNDDADEGEGGPW